MLMERAPRQQSDDRLIQLVAGIKAAAPDRTLQQIASQLKNMHECTRAAVPNGTPPPSSTCSCARNGSGSAKNEAFKALIPAL